MMEEERLATEFVDFSQLPDVAWVQIMLYLPLTDRENVSQTCTILNDVYCHPSVWHTARINLLLDESDSVPGFWDASPSDYLKLVTRFGHFIQDLTVEVTGYIEALPPECEAVIQELSQKCRLESLTLEVDLKMSTRDFHTSTPRTVNLDSLASFVSNAFRLKSFFIINWPLSQYVKSTTNILDALKNNKKVKQLEKLSLYYMDAEKATWVTLNAQVPLSSDVLSLVTKYSQLQVLCLRSSMLDNAILEELSRSPHLPLQKLSILVTTNSVSKPTPDISSRAWNLLKTYSENLQVDVTIATRISDLEISKLMKPEIPLVSISFMKYSKCRVTDLEVIQAKYHKTLQKFVNCTDTADADSELTNLINTCKNLKYLVYYGKIKADTIKILAESKGKKWTCFKFMKDCISTIQEEDTFDPDQIICRDADGNVRINRPQSMLESEEERALVLENLCEIVSSTVGYKWKYL